MPLIDSALTDKVTNDDESMRFVSNLATAASTYGLHEVLIAAVAWGMARGQIAGAAAAIESLDRVVAERTAPA